MGAVTSDFIVRISANLIGYDKQIEAAKRKIASLASDVMSAGAAMTAGITAPIVALGAASLRSFGEIDALKRGLAGLEGGAAGAERRFRELLEVAKLPGLGIKEAVQADLALRNYGFSAEKAKQVTLQFGNALALAGRGKEDLAELTRQMGQLKSRGIPTMDNLRTIMERIPQSAAIIQKQFGTINTEVLQKMGVTSDQLIEAVLGGLSKLERVSGGWKNAMENIQDSVTIALAEIGQSIAPAAERFVTQFIIPVIEGAKDLAKQFRDLPESAQTAILGFIAIAAAAGPTVYATGALAGSITNVLLLLGKIPSAAALATAALSITPWLLVGAGVAYAALQIKEWVEVTKDAQNADRSTAQMFFNTIDVLSNAGADMQAFRVKYAELIHQLKNARDLGLPINAATLAVLRAANAELIGLARTWVPVTAETKKAADATQHFGMAAQKTKEHVKLFRPAIETLEYQLARFRAEAEQHNYQTLLQSVDRLQQFLRQNSDRAVEFAGSFQFIGDGWRTAGRVFEEMNAGLKVSLQYWPILPDLIISTSQALAGLAATMVGEALGSINDGMRQFRLEAELNAEQNRRIGKAGTDAAKERIKEEVEAAKKQAEIVKKANEDMRRHVQRHVHELSNDLGELIMKGGKFGEVMASTFKRIGQSLISAAIEKQLSRIASLLVDIIAKSGLAGKVLGAVFGAGASAAGGAASAAGGVAGAAGSAVGGIGGAAGGVAGAAGSGVAGIVGAVGSVVSAVSSVIGNFQMAGMNKSLDLIEKATRYSEAYLLQLIKEAQQWWPKINDCHLRLKQMVDNGVGVWNQPGHTFQVTSAGVAGGSSIVFSNCTFNGTSQSDVDRFMRSTMERLRLGGQV